jgi:hypothetical protein
MYCHISWYMQRRPLHHQHTIGESLNYSPYFDFVIIGVWTFYIGREHPVTTLYFIIFVSFSFRKLSYCLFKLLDYFLLPTSLLWSMDLGRLQIWFYLLWVCCKGQSTMLLCQTLSFVLENLQHSAFLWDLFKVLGVFNWSILGSLASWSMPYFKGTFSAHGMRWSLRLLFCYLRVYFFLMRSDGLVLAMCLWVRHLDCNLL